MAYKRKTSRGSKTSRYSRSGYSSRKRSYSKSRGRGSSSRNRRSSPATVKLVIEQVAPAQTGVLQTTQSGVAARKAVF